MYACSGKYPQRTALNEFSVSSSSGEKSGISGEEITLADSPRIKISLAAVKPTKSRVKVRLLRSGEVIKGYQGELPMEIDFEDQYIKPGEKIYYRMDLHGNGLLVSNPIFVNFKQ
jgi:hypothetical protein